jgi:WD40 repeat protein
VPTLLPTSFDAHVIGATFLADRATFALADGRVALGVEADQTIVQPHADAILAFATSLDGKSVLTSGDDGRVMRIDAKGDVQLVAERKSKWIDQLASGPQGAVAFAAGRTAWVALGDGQVLEFPHEKAVGAVGFLPKGLRLTTATTDKARLLWVTAKGSPVDFDWKGAHTGITTSPDGRFLVTTMQEPALHGWRIEDGKHMRMTGYPTKVKSISWSAKGKYLATSGASAAILWPFSAKDGPMGKAPLQLGVTPQVVTRVACHPTEDVVAIGYDNGLILAVRFADQAEVVLRAPVQSPVSALAWSGDGGLIAFGTESGEAGVIDIRT